MLRLSDAATLDGVRIRQSDGAMLADCAVARTGIQLYAGDEVGRPELPVVRVWRPAEEVMSDAAAGSLAHRPVTIDHPAELVTSDTWKDVAVGQTSDAVEKRDGVLRVPLMLSDAAAISQVQAGKRELSLGYTCQLDHTPGTTPEGEAFDAVQRDIRINHVAVVDRGRAGIARIGDAANSWGPSPISDHKQQETPAMADLKSVALGDKAVQVAVSDAATTEAFRDGMNAKLDKLTTDHAAVVADKDKELATKDAEIATLKAKALDASALDKMVADRADLIASAKVMAKDADFAGLSDADIRRKAVETVRGAAAVTDKSDDYVSAAFDIALDAAKSTDPLAGPLNDAAKSKINDGSDLWGRQVFDAAGVAMKKEAA